MMPGAKADAVGLQENALRQQKNGSGSKVSPCFHSVRAICSEIVREMVSGTIEPSNAHLRQLKTKQTRVYACFCIARLHGPDTATCRGECSGVRMAERQRVRDRESDV